MDSAQVLPSCTDKYFLPHAHAIAYFPSKGASSNGCDAPELKCVSCNIPTELKSEYRIHGMHKRVPPSPITQTCAAVCFPQSRSIHQDTASRRYLGLDAVRKVSSTRLVCSGCASAADGDERVVTLGGGLIGAQVAVLDVVEHIAVGGVRWAFSLQLEDNHATAKCTQRGSGSRQRRKEWGTLARERMSMYVCDGEKGFKMTLGFVRYAPCDMLHYSYCTHYNPMFHDLITCSNHCGRSRCHPV